MEAIEATAGKLQRLQSEVPGRNCEYFHPTLRGNCSRKHNCWFFAVVSRVTTQQVIFVRSTARGICCLNEVVDAHLYIGSNNKKKYCNYKSAIFQNYLLRLQKCCDYSTIKFTIASFFFPFYCERKFYRNCDKNQILNKYKTTRERGKYNILLRYNV